MSVNKIEVKIEGVSPLLMHAFPMSELPEGWEKKEPKEQAETFAYRDPDKKLYVPGVAVQRCLVNAATYSKGKGRATLQKPVAACVLISPERIILKQQSYIVDTRPVVVPSTRGRILRHRPRFDEWELTFIVEYDDGLLSEKQIRNVVDDAGSRVGLLDFRPQNKGPFGRFMVTGWNGKK